MAKEFIKYLEVQGDDLIEELTDDMWTYLMKKIDSGEIGYEGDITIENYYSGEVDESEFNETKKHIYDQMNDELIDYLIDEGMM